MLFLTETDAKHPTELLSLIINGIQLQKGPQKKRQIQLGPVKYCRGDPRTKSKK
jgi:hypothetical protein